MKKNLLSGIAILAIAALASFNVNMNNQRESSGLFTLADVEALALIEKGGGTSSCVSGGSYCYLALPGGGYFESNVHKPG